MAEIIQANKLKQKELARQKIEASCKHIMPWRVRQNTEANWPGYDVREMQKFSYYMLARLDARKNWKTPDIDKDDLISEAMLEAVQAYTGTISRRDMSKALNRAYYAYWIDRIKNIQPETPNLIDLNAEFNLVEDDLTEFDEKEQTLAVNDNPDGTKNISVYMEEKIHAAHTLQDVEAMFGLTLDTEEKVISLLIAIEEGKVTV